MSTVKTNNVQIGQSVTATNNFTWYQPSSPDGTVRLGNGNSGSVTDLVTLTSAGNLGIGTSSPGAKIDAQGATAAEIRITATSAAGAGNYAAFRSVNGAGNASIFGTGTTAGSYSYTGEIANAAFVGSLGNYPLQLVTNSIARATLDASGNLGLGVTPSAWASSVAALQLPTGAFYSYVSGSVSNFYMLSNAYLNSGGSPTYKQTAAAAQYLQSAGQHIWYTAPSGTAGNAISFTQAMTLDASGNLLVGLTASAGSGYTLQVKGAFNFTNSSGNPVCSYDPSNGYLYMAPIYNKTTAAAANVFVGSAPGDMYRSTSALKYKQDIRDLESIDINKFRPVRYRSKCENDDQSKDHFGIIADEALEAGFPELVIFGADGEPEGFQYERLTAVLVKAIQELSAELNLLKQKVNA